MVKLLGLITLPLRLVLKLMKLPLTIMSCITSWAAWSWWSVSRWP